MEVAGIYTEFHQSLLSFIRNKVRSREDAEDILQNVFIKISSNLNKLANKEKLRSWVFTITRNAIVDYYRANGAAKDMVGDSALETAVLEEVEPGPGLDLCIERMIALLPEGYRDVIIDSEIKGIKQKDLALKYGLAYPSIRSRVQRGRERLKALFYDCCHIETDRRGNVMEVKKRDDGNGPCNPCTDKI